MHRLSHVQYRLQEHLDRSQRHRVHVVEQRGDQARHRLSHAWEDQEKYKGGWEKKNGSIRLKQALGGLTNIFFNPNLPTMDDYYEPWTYDYENLFNAPEGDDQPTARAVSMITGKVMDSIEAGPNWDDDLGGSPLYAEQRRQSRRTDRRRARATQRGRARGLLLPAAHLQSLSQPRLCGGVPRRRDLQTRRRRHRAALAGKVPRLAHVHFGLPLQEDLLQLVVGQIGKVYFVLPAPRIGTTPRLLPLLRGTHPLFGSAALRRGSNRESALPRPTSLVAAQRAMIMDPFDPASHRRREGQQDSRRDDRRRAEFARLQVRQEVADRASASSRLPHPAHAFYVPPMLPVLAKTKDGNYDVDGLEKEGLPAMLSSLEKARMPIKYMASLFSAGNVPVVEEVYRKLIAVRIFKRAQKVKDYQQAEVDAALTQGKTNAEEVEAIFRLTSLPTYEERFVIPPLGREVAVEAWESPLDRKREAGFGVRNKIAKRKF
jgi:nitrate reductase beta subunit